MIAPGHAQITDDELWKEGKVEADENENGTELTADFRVHPAHEFRPPEMQSAQEGHDHATNHDIVEVGHDEVSIVEMNIRS